MPYATAQSIPACIPYVSYATTLQQTAHANVSYAIRLQQQPIADMSHPTALVRTQVRDTACLRKRGRHLCTCVSLPPWKIWIAQDPLQQAKRARKHLDCRGLANIDANICHTEITCDRRYSSGSFCIASFLPPNRFCDWHVDVAWGAHVPSDARAVGCGMRGRACAIWHLMYSTPCTENPFIFSWYCMLSIACITRLLTFVLCHVIAISMNFMRCLTF